MPTKQFVKKQRVVNASQLVKEADFQKTVTECLTNLGYVVMTTSARGTGQNKTAIIGALLLLAPKTHRFFDAVVKKLTAIKGSGVDKGIPDIFIRNPKWVKGCFFGAELKGQKTELSPEQESLVLKGHYSFFRSLKDLLESLLIFEIAQGTEISSAVGTRLRSFLRDNPSLK